MVARGVTAGLTSGGPRLNLLRSIFPVSRTFRVILTASSGCARHKQVGRPTYTPGCHRPMDVQLGQGGILSLEVAVLAVLVTHRPVQT